MSKISDSVELTKILFQQYNFATQCIPNSYINLSKNIYETIEKQNKILNMILPTINNSFLQFSNQLTEIYNMQLIFQNIEPTFDETIKKFEHLKPNIKNEILSIKENYSTDLSDEEFHMLDTLNNNIENTSKLIKMNDLSVETKQFIINLIVTILLGVASMYQNHIYHVEDSKADELFQNKIIELLQEIVDNSHSSIEFSPQTVENNETQVDGNH